MQRQNTFPAILATSAMAWRTVRYLEKRMADCEKMEVRYREASGGIATITVSKARL